MSVELINYLSNNTSGWFGNYLSDWDEHGYYVRNTSSYHLTYAAIISPSLSYSLSGVDSYPTTASPNTSSLSRYLL